MDRLERFCCLLVAERHHHAHAKAALERSLHPLPDLERNLRRHAV
jgi:hypothetical protein